MRHLLRNLLGMLAIALLWGISWAALGALLSVVVGIVDPDDIGAGEGPVRIGAILGSFGLASGLVFGVVLSLAERHRDVLDLSLLRVALWGAVASTTIPLVAGKPDQMIPFCPVGALVAVLLVVTARRSSWMRSVLGDVFQTAG